jgi:hypothetical protein
MINQTLKKPIHLMKMKRIKNNFFIKQEEI